MRTICLTIGFLCLAVLLVGQKPEAPPAITDAHRAQFFKAQLQVNQAQAAMTAAQQTFQAAVADLSKDCGEKFAPSALTDQSNVVVANTRANRESTFTVLNTWMSMVIAPDLCCKATGLN